MVFTTLLTEKTFIVSLSFILYSSQVNLCLNVMATLFTLWCRTRPSPLCSMSSSSSFTCGVIIYHSIHISASMFLRYAILFDMNGSTFPLQVTR